MVCLPAERPCWVCAGRLHRSAGFRLRRFRVGQASGTRRHLSQAPKTHRRADSPVVAVDRPRWSWSQQQSPRPGRVPHVRLSVHGPNKTGRSPFRAAYWGGLQTPTKAHPASLRFFRSFRVLRPPAMFQAALTKPSSWRSASRIDRVTQRSWPSRRTSARLITYAPR